MRQGEYDYAEHVRKEFLAMMAEAASRDDDFYREQSRQARRVADAACEIAGLVVELKAAVERAVLAISVAIPPAAEIADALRALGANDDGEVG